MPPSSPTAAAMVEMPTGPPSNFSMMQRSTRGRMATSQAYRHFGYEPPTGAAGAQPNLFGG